MTSPKASFGKADNKADTRAVSKSPVEAKNTHKEIREFDKNSDSKMAEGIKILCQIKRPKEAKQYNEQGICTVVISADELKQLKDERGIGKWQEIKASFPPNCLQHGITIHFQKPGRRTYFPSVKNMVETKIDSILKNLPQPPDYPDYKYLKDKKLDKNDVLNDPNFRAYYEDLMEKIAKIDTDDPSYRNKQNFAKINKQIEKLILHAQELAFQKAYEHLEQRKSSWFKHNKKTFRERILKIAKRKRSDLSDILSVDSNMRFSYEQTNAVTAHDRSTESQLANAGLFADGQLLVASDGNIIGAIVTSSSQKHGVLAPEEGDKNEMLLATCEHLKEVLENLALKILHGRDPNDKNPLKIDWVYQLLTSNISGFKGDEINDFALVARAVKLMDGYKFKINGVEVIAHTHLFNAGIAKIGAAGIRITQNDAADDYNKETYLAISTSVQGLSSPTLSEMKDIQNKNKTDFISQVELLRASLMPKLDQSNSKSDYSMLVAIQKDEAAKREQCQKLIDEISAHKAAIASFNAQLKPNETNKELKDQIKQVTANQAELYYQLLKLEAELEQSIHSGAGVTKKNVLIRKIYEECQRQFETKIPEINKLIGEITNNPVFQVLEKQAQSSDSKISGPATDQILNIAALIIKSRMDELFYRNKHLSHENAVIFNSYLNVYNKICGIMTSIGCKSANDRTLIARLFIAALMGKPYSIPPNLLENAELRNVLKDISQMIMVHVAVYGTQGDTSGAVPKGGGSKFPITEPIENVQVFKNIGEEIAAHKAKPDEVKLKPYEREEDLFVEIMTTEQIDAANRELRQLSVAPLRPLTRSSIEGRSSTDIPSEDQTPLRPLASSSTEGRSSTDILSDLKVDTGSLQEAISQSNVNKDSLDAAASQSLPSNQPSSASSATNTVATVAQTQPLQSSESGDRKKNDSESVAASSNLRSPSSRS